MEKLDGSDLLFPPLLSGSCHELTVILCVDCDVFIREIIENDAFVVPVVKMVNHLRSRDSNTENSKPSWKKSRRNMAMSSIMQMFAGSVAEKFLRGFSR